MPRAGVLLVNLGSPEAPTAPALRRYLGEFLSDPRVVDLPRWLWLPLLYGVVLPRRAPRSAALYARIWTPEGSPLVTSGRRLAERLGEVLGDRFVVAAAMRYGAPSLEDGLARLQASGCATALVVPLFPQYSEATFGSIVARVGQVAARPSLQVRCVAPYPTDAGYLDALAARCRDTLAAGPVDHHVFSFHGVPQRVIARGDPYREQCAATADALAARLGLPADRWTLAWQSRFGPGAWLEPATDRVVPELAARAPRVLVCTPGFAADCLETIDEIGRDLDERFRAAGGQELRRVPCLDEHPRWVEALATIVRAQAEGAPTRA